MRSSPARRRPTARRGREARSAEGADDGGLADALNGVDSKLSSNAGASVGDATCSAGAGMTEDTAEKTEAAAGSLAASGAIDSAATDSAVPTGATTSDSEGPGAATTGADSAGTEATGSGTSGAATTGALTMGSGTAGIAGTGCEASTIGAIGTTGAESGTTEVTRPGGGTLAPLGGGASDSPAGGT